METLNLLSVTRRLNPDWFQTGSAAVALLRFLDQGSVRASLSTYITKWSWSLAAVGRFLGLLAICGNSAEFRSEMEIIAKTAQIFDKQRVLKKTVSFNSHVPGFNRISIGGH